MFQKREIYKKSKKINFFNLIKTYFKPTLILIVY